MNLRDFGQPPILAGERSGLQTQVTNVEVRSVDFEVVDFLYYLSTASGIFPRRCKVDKATRQISGFGLMSWFHVFSKDGKAKSDYAPAKDR